jgi:hypothetical protein
MATQDDVRRIARSLPEVIEDDGHFAFSVLRDGKSRGFVWVWMERVNPKRPRVARPGVIAARLGDGFEKEAMLASNPEKFFTEPHYNGFPAVLVRLEAIDEDELNDLITDAWRSQAPPGLVRDFEVRAAARQ